MAEAGKIFRELTEQELLDRVPRKPYFSTPDIAKIFKVTETTVLRWAGGDQLTKYESRGRGGANLYRRADIVRFIGSRYEVVPKQKPERIRDANSKTKAKRKKKRRSGK